MTKNDIVYLAALIDGEGYIGLSKEVYKPTGRHSLNPRIVIGNTYRPVITWLHQTFPGGFIVENKPIGNRQWSYRWNLCSWGKIHALLSKVRPYLRIKHGQADTLIAMYSGNRRDLRRLRTIKKLNRRGRR